MSDHPRTAFAPLLRDELTPAEHARVTAHVTACADCARALEETRDVLARLAASLPAAPDVHWPAYRAQLRERLRTRRAAAAGWRRFMQPVPIAASAAAAALLVVLASQTAFRAGDPASDAAFEEVVIGERLPLLQQYPVMEQLDLLEDLDIIRQLDHVAVREG